METLDQLASWLIARRDSEEAAAAALVEGSAASDRHDAGFDAAAHSAQAAAFSEAHEKVMLMIQLEEAAEQAPAVESTLPIDEVKALFATNPVLTLDTCVQAGLEMNDAREALQHLAAEGQLALSVEGHTELWALV